MNGEKRLKQEGKDDNLSLGKKNRRKRCRHHESIGNDDAQCNFQGETAELISEDLPQKVYSKEKKIAIPQEFSLTDPDTQGSSGVSKFTDIDGENLEEGVGSKEMNLDSNGKMDNLNKLIIESAIPGEPCCVGEVSDNILKDEDIKVFKRKKHATGDASLVNTMGDRDLEESICSSVSERRCSMVDEVSVKGENIEINKTKNVFKVPDLESSRKENIIDSIEKEDLEMVVHGNAFSDGKFLQTYSRKRKKLCHREISSPTDLIGSPEKSLIEFSRRKLLILDVNGLLVDIVACAPSGYTADITISRKSVFKRPHCDEFLQFCFENFDLGIWSSRTKRNLDNVIDFLMGHYKQKLLFCWDQFQCTDTGYSVPGSQSKPLFLKELRKVWDKHDPDVPWKKGYYNESNTILLDDSPYKALRNPPYTAIFPPPFRYSNSKDDALGPGGDLRVYLEGLAMAENVQTYIEKNPFGHSAITKEDPSWSFFSCVRDGDKQKRESCYGDTQDRKYYRAGDQQQRRHPGDRCDNQHPGDHCDNQHPGDNQHSGDNQHPGDHGNDQHPGDHGNDQHPGDHGDNQHPGGNQNLGDNQQQVSHLSDYGDNQQQRRHPGGDQYHGQWYGEDQHHLHYRGDDQQRENRAQGCNFGDSQQQERHYGGNQYQGRYYGVYQHQGQYHSGYQRQGQYHSEHQRHGQYHSEHQRQGQYHGDHHRQGQYHGDYHLQGQYHGDYHLQGQYPGGYRHQGQYYGDYQHQGQYYGNYQNQGRFQGDYQRQGRYNGDDGRHTSYCDNHNFRWNQGGNGYNRRYPK